MTGQDTSRWLEMSGVALARAIREREVTSRAVVDAHIARIETVNPQIRAVVADRYVQARAEADAADERLATSTEDLPPLFGVPTTIKESFQVTGMPNTGGSHARRGIVSTSDATSVARIRAAGAIVLGVTNLSELCMWMESANPVYGRTGNAYHPDHIAGGSSGGEGSIVGAGGSPFGLGADVGGSIRLPAFFNGVFGHKPSPGLIPNSGQFPAVDPDGAFMLGTGPIARRAEDLEVLVRLLAGPDGEDVECRPMAFGDPATIDFAGMNVLNVVEDGVTGVHPALRAAQTRAADALTAAGAKVRRRTFHRLERAFDMWTASMSSGNERGSYRKLLGVQGWSALLGHALRPWELGGTYTLPSIVLGLVEDVGHLMPGRASFARAETAALKAELIDALGDGVMLYPTWRAPAPKHGRPLLNPLSWVYTAAFNALGLPVTQVPLGFDARGLPVGVQVVTAPGNDHVSIAVALELERRLGGWTPPWKV
jgi:fatty acid amide hydrolase 2